METGKYAVVELYITPAATEGSAIHTTTWIVGELKAEMTVGAVQMAVEARIKELSLGEWIYSFKNVHLISKETFRTMSPYVNLLVL